MVLLIERAKVVNCEVIE